jgi:hypothetical protein
MAKDSPILFVRRKGETLVPYARFDADLLARYRQDVRLRAEITEPRSLPSHRYYWAALQAVCEATGKWPNAEALHRAMKLHLGIIETLASVQGEPIILPGSTAFRALDESQFRQYADSAFTLISTHICPGLTVDDLLLLAKGKLGADEAAG